MRIDLWPKGETWPEFLNATWWWLWSGPVCRVIGHKQVELWHPVCLRCGATYRNDKWAR